MCTNEFRAMSALHSIVTITSYHRRRRRGFSSTTPFVILTSHFVTKVKKCFFMFAVILVKGFFLGVVF